MQEMENQPLSTTAATEATETTTNSEDFLFDENDVLDHVEPVETEETPIEPAITEESKEEPKGEQAKAEEAEFLEVVYNGEKKGLSHEEAVTLAQKGMNYDKLYDRYTQTVNDPAVRELSEMAKTAGMDTATYVATLKQFINEQAKQNFIQNYQRQHPNTDIEVIEELAEAQMARNETEAKQAQVNQAAQAKQAHDRQMADQIVKMHDLYPDVDVTNLPQEVINDMANNGMGLVESYQKFELAQTSEKLRAVESNKKNSTKATGSVSTNASSVAESDPFLSGLLGK